jgi:hypothetical protein
MWRTIIVRTLNLQTETAMCLTRRALLIGLVMAAFSIVGCGVDDSKGMPNMKPGTGDVVEKQMPLKGGKKKPLPPEPPGPQAPP